MNNLLTIKELYCQLRGFKRNEQSKLIQFWVSLSDILEETWNILINICNYPHFSIREQFWEHEDLRDILWEKANKVVGQTWHGCNYWWTSRPEITLNNRSHFLKTIFSIFAIQSSIIWRVDKVCIKKSNLFWIILKLGSDPFHSDSNFGGKYSWYRITFQLKMFASCVLI